MPITPTCLELPYPPDGARLFAALADRPWAAFLDSGPPQARQGRYEILAADPQVTLVTRGAETVITAAGETRRSGDDPLSLLGAELARLPALTPGDWPFPGGALGWFGYDLARRFEPGLPARHRAAEEGDGLPEMAVGLYDCAAVIDHHARRATLIGWGEPARLERLRDALLAGGERPRPPFRALGPVVRQLSEAAYGEAFARIRRYLREGDCYQVNFAQRFTAAVTGDPWEGYLRLRQRNPAPFAAYLTTPFGRLLSCSPERFLQVRAGEVETRPIKGTIARAADPAADAAARAALAASAKDRAENLMIVDLLRNDLGRSCAVGSVRVPRLFEVESFATVHHLVSSVTGRLAHGRSALDLLRGCFPGGSVTGAPKRRAMEIIEALEGRPRGVYCGAIGYLGADGGMDTNITIRTLALREGEASFWAGGGIVYDSTCDGEYRESLAKARAFLEFLAGGATEL